jgi:hypothetical protein
MESMKLVGRGFRSATKASQRAYLRRPLGSPRRQIAEPRSSMCQCPAGWNLQKSGFLRIGLATEIASITRAVLVKFSFRSGTSPNQCCRMLHAN